MGGICSKISVSCIEADAKQAAEEAEQVLVFAAKICGYLNTGTQQLISFLTALKTTTTDPKIISDLTGAITILEAIKNISSIIAEAPTALNNFEVPANAAAIGNDVDNIKTMTTNISGVVTSLNKMGVKTGVTDATLTRLNGYMDSATQAHTQKKAPVIFSRPASLGSNSKEESKKPKSPDLRIA